MASPAKIRKLDEVVINRIAAGEIIQRPANALKELLENSLDANSTNISVTLKAGGLKLIQIQDNGCGIRKEDMEIVCERFTTSKLRQYEELGTIATFGFRGEALASISHVAHLTIVTKTSGDPCAYKGVYEDGKLRGPLKACAGNQGTQITAEDLFYNVATRRRALKSASDEHARVADVVGRYAIHNPKVGFSLKKSGENLSDFKTNPDSTHIDNIRVLYGNTIARELLEVKAEDEVFQFSVAGYVSSVNYSAKKQTFILFINNRLVDSTSLRRALESVYSVYLPKGNHPFIYLSLSLDSRNVDVNVHPTKHEVHFLHEESIVENVKMCVEAKLLGANSSRTFYTQTRLPGVDINLKETVLEKKNKEKGPSHTVRTDHSLQKLDKFLSQEKKPDEGPSAQTPPRREIRLTSVLELRREVEESVSLTLNEMLGKLTLVGVIDPSTALVQISTDLCLLKTRNLLKELFYQIVLYDFANFGIIKFKEGLCLKQVCEVAESGERAQAASDLLDTKAPLLLDYFSIEISGSPPQLHSIPLLLEGYEPDMSRLPELLNRLAFNVDWSSEKECFRGVATHLASFYCHLATSDSPLGERSKGWKWVTEHVAYPAVKATLLPPEKLARDETILQLASLHQLYKVFERC